MKASVTFASGALLALALVDCSDGATSNGFVWTTPTPSNEPRYDFGCPQSNSLACTGLYGEVGEHWFSKQLGPGIRAFQPSAKLWSDGMDKQRYVWLPPGAQIDASSPDDWVVPVGTRFWKEFAYRGKRIETRYIEKRLSEETTTTGSPKYYWHRTTYRWTDDGSSASELDSGELNVAGTNGNSYEIPSSSQCDSCHKNGADYVLGFDQVLLSTPGATGTTWSDLNAEQLVGPPLTPLTIPGDLAAQAALGYLHANCGVSCHNDHTNALASLTQFFMKLQVGHMTTVEDTNVYRTGVGVESYIYSLDFTKLLRIIEPGDPEESAVIFRASKRDLFYQMPPIATHVVDPEGLALLRAWIQELPPKVATP